MSANTKIEWTHAGLGKGASWNPLRDGALDEKTLLEPLRWRKPRGILVVPDVFADFVTDEILDRVFAVAALCPQHRFIFETKRSRRMREHFREETRHSLVATKVRDYPLKIVEVSDFGWPLKNCWLGVSCENQETADERIPDLLATPAAVRFISAEPMLGPVDVYKWLKCPWICELCYREAYGDLPQDWELVCQSPLCPECRRRLTADTSVDVVTGGAYATKPDPRPWKSPIHWVICGGESGPNARPMNPDWARSIAQQSRASGVAFFMKQMAKRATIPSDLMIREFPEVST